MIRKKGSFLAVALCGSLFATALCVMFALAPIRRAKAFGSVSQCPSCYSDDISELDNEPASCDEAGYVSFMCNDCSYSWGMSIPPRGHVFTHATNPATCTEDGSDVAVCTACGFTTTTTIPATGHVFPDQWTLERAPSATEPGLESRVCTVCGEKETRVVSDLLGDVVTPTPTAGPDPTDPTGSDPTPEPGGTDVTTTPEITGEVPSPTDTIPGTTPAPTPTKTPTVAPTPTASTVPDDGTGTIGGGSDTDLEGATPSVTDPADPSSTIGLVDPGLTATISPTVTIGANADTTPGDPQGGGDAQNGTVPDGGVPSDLETIGTDEPPTPAGGPAIIAIIVGILGIAAIVTLVTVRGRRAKKPVSPDIKQSSEGDGPEAPELKDQTVVTMLKKSPRAEQLLEAMDKRPFLLVKRSEPGDTEALEALVKDEKPKLVLIDAAVMGDLESFKALKEKLSEACDDSGFALLFEGKEHASVFGEKSLRNDPKYKGMACYTSSDEAILTKLILPVYKPDFSMDNVLDGIGNIAEAFGIPMLSTFTKIVQVGGNVKEAVEDRKLDKGNLTEILGNISEVFGFDLGGDLADAADFLSYEKEKHFEKKED
ncbi:MAG: hypothetical protein ILP10_03640 [Lachnospiraceae bacterium]|nr:hypothetical protein [Lachnospiraceae bacterium]